MDLGITDAFDKDLADFSNMTDADTGLFVYDALHKANIDFTENFLKSNINAVYTDYSDFIIYFWILFEQDIYTLST